jgi:hypothetical protein
MFKSLQAAACVAALVCAGSAASAATMTFTGLPAEGAEFTEDGIHLRALDYYLGGYIPNKTFLGLDDSEGDDPRSVVFTMPGSRFDATSVSIRGGTRFQACDDNFENCSRSYDNVLWRGYRDGALVAEDNFTAFDVFTHTFSAAFSDLDALFLYALVAPNGFCASYPCSPFGVDDLMLQPLVAQTVSRAVPGPVAGAGLPVLLALAFWVRRRPRPHSSASMSRSRASRPLASS